MIPPTITREISTPIIVSGIPYNVHYYTGVKDGAPIIAPHYGADGTVGERVGGGTPIVLNDRVRGDMDSGSTKQIVPPRAGRCRESDSSERIVPTGGVGFDSDEPVSPPIGASSNCSRSASPQIR